MNTFYIMLIVISSIVLPIRVKALNHSIKSGNKERIKMEWLFLGLTITLILGLILFNKYR